MNITEAVKQVRDWVEEDVGISTVEADRLLIVEIIKLGGFNQDLLSKMTEIISESNFAIDTSDFGAKVLDLWDELNKEPEAIRFVRHNNKAGIESSDELYTKFMLALCDVPGVRNELFTNYRVVLNRFSTNNTTLHDISCLLVLYDQYTTTPKQRRIRELKEELARLERE